MTNNIMKVKKSSLISGSFVATIMGLHVVSLTYFSFLLISVPDIFQVIFWIFDGFGIYSFLFLTGLLENEIISLVIVLILLYLFWVFFFHLLLSKKFWHVVFAIIILFLHIILPIIIYLDTKIV